MLFYIFCHMHSWQGLAEVKSIEITVVVVIIIIVNIIFAISTILLTIIDKE